MLVIMCLKLVWTSFIPTLSAMLRGAPSHQLDLGSRSLSLLYLIQQQCLAILPVYGP
jgi:hypothetical protein